jgi:hypothetical protein
MNRALKTVLRDFFKSNIPSCNTAVGALFKQKRETELFHANELLSKIN